MRNVGYRPIPHQASAHKRTRGSYSKEEVEGATLLPLDEHPITTTGSIPGCSF